LKKYLDLAIRPPVKWIELEKDTEYAFWVEGDTAYLSFQGSLSLTDWIYNFMAWSIIGVHAGMWKKFQILSFKLFDFMYYNLDKKFVFLGHSQGAGIALIALVEMSRLFNQKGFTAHLFGCPKIYTLWKAFASRQYCKEVNQYQVQTDIVPRLSPVNCQVGKIIKLGEKKPFWKWKIADHYPSAYRKYLEDKCV